MSKRAKLVERFWAERRPDYFNDVEKAKEHMEKRSLEEDEPYKIPKMIYKSKVEDKDMFGCQMITFNDTDDAERLVIYLHGGIYVNEIVLPHITFCDKLAKRANACVFAPIYPLAPNHTYKESYKIVEDLYNYFLSLEKPITIMGDSAGGGLALAFAEYLGANDIQQPAHLVLICPWLDITMSGDYSSVEYDPIGGIETLREMGKAWAGDLDLKDYRVSPMFGDVSKLSKTTLFVGTHETLYADVTEFYKKLKDNGVDAELNIGEGMNHVYPIYPFVPESKEAFEHIVEVIRD